MKFSLYDQNWNKYDSFVNLKIPTCLYTKICKKMCLILWNCAECGI